MGDVCDNACGFGTTTLAIVGAASATPGGWLELVATGRSPAAQVLVGGVASALQVTAGKLLAQVPASLATGQSYRVELVNPEGCRSQEVVNLTIGNPPSSCGLTGFEAFALLGLVAGARRLRRRLAA